MHIELAPEVEATLAEEAGRQGLTATELSTKLLTEHATKWRPRNTSSSPEKEALLNDFIARMKERSPGWETRDPYAVDWQAVKAEGRKY